MIEVENVTKEYGSFTAVKDLSFSVGRGEILGFLGPNGAGKTTTMRVLTGFFPPTTGAVRVAGHDVLEAPLEAKAKIGYLPENPPLYPEMSVLAYLRFAAQIKGVARKVLASRVDAVVERCQLQEVRNKPTGNLSKGYRQRVGIAQALVHEPEVLVLDEPTAGLDPKQIGDTRELIKTLGGDHTVILSTHILPEVAITCDRVAIINRGRLVAHGTPESLTEQFRTTSVVDITVQGEPASVADVLSGFTDILSFERQERGESGATSWRLEIAKGADVRRSLSEQIVARGLGLLELRQSGVSLEEIYLRAVSAPDPLDDQ